MKLTDGQLVQVRMDALRMAAGLRDGEAYGSMMQQHVRPAQTAEGVIAAAEKFVQFALKPAA